jgi:cyanophycinase
MPFFRDEPRSGFLIAHGGGTTGEDTARAFVARAGGPAKLIFVLAQSNEDAAKKGAGSSEFLSKAGGARTVEAPPITRSDDPVIPELARRIAREAGGVWMPGGDQRRFLSVFARTPVPDALRALLARGGAVGGSSAGAALLGEWMPTGDGDRTKLTRDNVQTAPGLNLLPGFLFDTHFLARERMQRLVGMVLRQPGLVGVGVEQDGWAEVDRARGVLTVRAGQVVTVRAAGPVRTAGPLDPRLSCPDVRLRVLAPGESVPLEDLRRK